MGDNLALVLGALWLLALGAWVFLYIRFQAERLAKESLARESSSLQEERARLNQALEAMRARENRYLQEVATLKTALEKEQEATKERSRFFEESHERLKLEFSELAQKLLEEKGKRLGELQNERLGGLLKPFEEQIKSFRQKVEESHLEEMKGRASLEGELKHLKELNLKISEEALQLAQALKGDSKTQGSWGEMILEKILEDSGLVKGREYEVQASFKDEEGRFLRPDVVIHLPENRDVVVDSKVSLSAYERFVNSEESDQARHIQDHIQSIKNHIKGLSGKSYDSLLEGRSLDFVLMFIPIEGAFIEALRHDSGLFSRAYEHHIILVSPSTLLVTLRTIHHIWRYERQNQNAEEIAKRAMSLYDKLVGFSEDFLKIGDQLERSEKVYREALGKLKEGRGNLIHQARQLEELGVKGKKDFSSKLLGD